MDNAYWVGPKTDIDAHAGDTAGGYDAVGLHNSCRVYDRGEFLREAPIASWDLGPVTEVVIKCDDGIDMTVHYANFINKSHADMKTYVDTEANHYIPEAV